MSREIKFRVWDKTTNTMFEDAKNTYITIEFFIGMVDINGIKLDYENECEAVLMQYTGLKDKNIKKIYEGDILKEQTQSGFNYSVVKFGEIDISVSCEPKMCTCFYHYFSNFNDNRREVPLGNNLKNIEVIGNIYENPELFKAKL